MLRLFSSSCFWLDWEAVDVHKSAPLRKEIEMTDETIPPPPAPPPFPKQDDALPTRTTKPLTPPTDKDKPQEKGKE